MTEKQTPEMDDDAFITFLLCEKFWEWTKNPAEAVPDEIKRAVAKRYALNENSILFKMVISFLAGAGVGFEICEKMLAHE